MTAAGGRRAHRGARARIAWRETHGSGGSSRRPRRCSASRRRRRAAPPRPPRPPRRRTRPGPRSFAPAGRRGGGEVRRGPRARPGVRAGAAATSRAALATARPGGAAGRAGSTTPASTSSAPSSSPRTRRRYHLLLACSSSAAATSTRPAGGSTARSSSPRRWPRPASSPGDLYYQEGSLERARARVGGRARRAPGRAPHALRAKLERARPRGRRRGRVRARRQPPLHPPVRRDRSPREVARDRAAPARGGLRPALARVRARRPQHDIPVILYSRELFDEITRSPAWVAGTYDGKIRMPVGGLARRATTPSGSGRSSPTS